MLPRCFWTRKLELQLIDFVRERDAIWKPVGNTNHDIQLKYKAYAEFAAQLGRGFTARSVRDRWVNIRSTFNHNLRKVKQSQLKASSPAEVYVPCWPLWNPLQFLRVNTGLENQYQEIEVKPELAIKQEDNEDLNTRTDRPRAKYVPKRRKSKKCVNIINNLIEALNPLLEPPKPSYWFFGKHVAERLECMRERDAECASQEIVRLVGDWMQTDEFT